MLIAGIDPGLSGAVAILRTDSQAIEAIDDVPCHILARARKNKREVDAAALFALLDRFRLDHAYLELAGAMPGQGVSSVFAYGKSVGILIGLLTGLLVPTTFVAPAKWKRALSVPAAKDGARARASQLLPAAAHLWPRVKDHGRAEAALIALWGARAL